MNKLVVILSVVFGLSGFALAKAGIKDDIVTTQKKIEKLNTDLNCTTDQNCIALPYGQGVRIKTSLKII